MDEQKILNMDADQLADKISKLDSLNSELFKYFDEIKAKMDKLQGEWISNTANQVFNNFAKEKKNYQRIKTQHTKDFNFLVNARDNYIKMEKSVDELIEDKVAISDDHFFTEADKKATVDYTSGLNNEVVQVNNPNDN